jgi:hypothetical protein
MCKFDRIFDLRWCISLENQPESAIVYLPTIELPFSQVLDIRLVHSGRGVSFQEVSPNRLPGVRAQVWVFEWDVDSTLHRIVEIFHTIRREEQNTTIILERTQEHGDVSVTRVVERPPPQKNVSLI